MPKKTKEEDLINEPVILRDNPDRISKYDQPDLVSYVVENRNKNKTFVEIAEGLRERGFGDMNPAVLSETYAKALAKSTLVHNTAQEAFDDFSNELNKMYSQAIKVLSRQIEILDKIYDNFESSDMEEMQRYLMYIKLAPQIKSATETILKYTQEFREQQDKIITTKEGMIWNEKQMLGYINDYLPMLEKAGKIKILSPILK